MISQELEGERHASLSVLMFTVHVPSQPVQGFMWCDPSMTSKTVELWNFIPPCVCVCVRMCVCVMNINVFCW